MPRTRQRRVSDEEDEEYPDIPPTPRRYLNSTQFAGTAAGVHPHQLAIPGMEHMSHPWAKHLARGFMLDFSSSRHTHTLRAMDVEGSDPRYGPDEAAELNWERAHSHVPGEISHVVNYQAGGREIHGTGVAKGLAGALLKSAHHWNFGQETLPIHSPLRTAAGEHFATKYRPDLKPDVLRPADRGGSHVERRVRDKPEWEEPEWPNVGERFHPFQQEVEKHHPKQAKGQGTLF